ncbi:MAG: amidohydrolase family protein [Pseudomonadota bacterium]
MTGALERPLPPLNDAEGERIPEGLNGVVDAHVHLFPDELYASIWEWFRRHGWPIRYRLTAPQVVEFLLGRGIRHVVGLQYAHKPGVARRLNRFMADLCRQYPQLTGLASVLPGEEGAAEILQEAFSEGLSGVKLHAHVQCFDMDSPGMHAVYAACRSAGKPLVMHVGREPKSPAYDCDPYELCSAERLERVLKEYPGLRVCVPHLGADEFQAYADLLERYDTLWLDTTMMLADYLPIRNLPALTALRADRVMYGTDFPHIPYAWDRELKRLAAMGLPEGLLGRILGENAAEFFGLG